MNTSNPEFTFENAFEIQKEHLAKWKLLLKEKAYSLVEKEVELRNAKGYKRAFDVFRGSDIDNFVHNITKDTLKDKIKLNIIYTLEVQDGEHRYKQHTPQTIEVEFDGDTETINKEGERLARTFIQELPDDTEPNSGDWYEIEGGCRAIRYKSFEVIKDSAMFTMIERILYK